MPDFSPDHDPDGPSDAPAAGWVVLGTALAYAVCGVLALALAIPPSFASPLYPAAGVAMAAALVFGRPALLGAVIGGFLVHLLLALRAGSPGLSAVLVMPLWVGAAAALQAGLGAALVHRIVPGPLRLTEPREIVLTLVAGGLLATLTSTSLSHLMMWATGGIAADVLPSSWLTWWVGDSLGVLIAGPVALTLIGRPRADWVPRRWTVGAPLALVTLLTGLGIAQVARWEEERLQASFQREASALSTAVSARLREPLLALEAMRGVFVASTDVSREEMRSAATAWLADGQLTAIGWYDRVRREQLPAFEATVRAEGLPDFHVFDRRDAGAAPRGAELLVMRYIEPQAPNVAALGLNLLSVPAAAAAVEASARADAPRASAAFRLTQEVTDGDRQGVVVYRVVRSQGSMDGVVFVTLRPGPAVATIQRDFPDYLDTCLVDTDPQASLRRLAGAPGCDEHSKTLPYQHVRRIDFAGRAWELRVGAGRARLPVERGASALLFAIVGLLGAAMLGALLLTMTGRTRRIEAAVDERTAALRAEARERERAQAALRDSEQRFRNILNHVPIGVIYTDLDGVAKQTNPRFCELVGYSDDALLLMRAAQYTHPDDLAAGDALTAQLVRGELPVYRHKKRFIRRDGSLVWVQATVSLLRDEAGHARRIVAVVEDISEHLRLEEAETARERAEAANRAKSEFLSRMSHELRTPLNAMLGFAQLIELDRRHPIAPEQRPWVAQIQQAGWHLLDMINDVLDLSRIESGNLKLQLEPLNLPELVAASLAMVESETARRGITVSTELADGTGLVVGDNTRVKQILVNLLSNAVKYNIDGGRIHLATRLRDDRVELAVTDTGIGMTPEQLGELFQPFNRLGRERGGPQGTGIGLVISQRLAELMGGSLRARSLAGEGSSFIVTLPKAPDSDTVPSDLDALAAEAPDYHRRHVHYVEDNETNVEVMRGILAQRPQVVLDVSTNGHDALATLHRHVPDLVLLDMHLPDMNGLEILEALRDDPATMRVPVIVVSADATAQQIDAAVTAGAQGYLTKPVSVTELLATVDDLLERAQTRFG